jgi:hypothetical protein
MRPTVPEVTQFADKAQALSHRFQQTEAPPFLSVLDPNFGEFENDDRDSLLTQVLGGPDDEGRLSTLACIENVAELTTEERIEQVRIGLPLDVRRAVGV